MNEEESVKNMSYHRVRELLGLINEVNLPPALPWGCRMIRYSSARCQVCQGKGATPLVKVVGRRCVCPLCTDQISRKALLIKRSLREKHERMHRKTKVLWTWGKALEAEEIWVKDIGIEKYLLHFVE